jgi:hypothetical protein
MNYHKKNPVLLMYANKKSYISQHSLLRGHHVREATLAGLNSERVVGRDSGNLPVLLSWYFMPIHFLFPSHCPSLDYL